MTNLEVHQQLEMIQQMIQATRKKAMDTGDIFILWGVLELVVLGLAQLFDPPILHYIGFPLFVLGIGLTVYLVKRRKRKTRIRTFVDKFVSATWFGCVSAIAVAALMSHLSPNFENPEIMFIVCLIVGIGLMISGSAYQWRVLSGVGFLWWIGAVLVQVMPSEYIGVISALLLGFGMIVPGIVAQIHLKKIE